MIVTADAEDTLDMSVAKEVGEVLHDKYPGWLWAVTAKGGVVIVKCLNLSSLWGFVLKYKDIMQDAEVRKRKAVEAGGELLERCHMPRGPRPEGANPVVFEGARNWKR